MGSVPPLRAGNTETVWRVWDGGGGSLQAERRQHRQGGGSGSWTEAWGLGPGGAGEAGACSQPRRKRWVRLTGD